VAAVDVAKGLGIPRILSSGGAVAAPQGVAVLAAMMARAGPECIIMPGAGITAASLPHLAHLPLREIHASCGSVRPVDTRAAAMGFDVAGARRTDAAAVTALKTALAH
jgi:copper homeostasis protein